MGLGPKIIFEKCKDVLEIFFLIFFKVYIFASHILFCDKEFL